MLTLGEFNLMEHENMDPQGSQRMSAAEMFICLCKVSSIFEMAIQSSHQIVRWEHWKIDKQHDAPEGKLDTIMRMDDAVEIWKSNFLGFVPALRSQGLFQPDAGQLAVNPYTSAVSPTQHPQITHMPHIAGE